VPSANWIARMSSGSWELTASNAWSINASIASRSAPSPLALAASNTENMGTKIHFRFDMINPFQSVAASL